MVTDPCHTFAPVTQIIDVMVSFPTVVFTVPFVFCLVWFLVGLIASGFDVGEGDFDVDLDGDGDIDAFEHLAGALHLGSLGLPLALLMLSFGAWASSLLFSVGMQQLGAEDAFTIIGGLVLGVVVGVVFVWKVGGSIGRALSTEQAPERSSAVGCVCKVRTVHVSDRFGDAEMLSGPMRPSIIQVRAPEGRFRRGDVALVVEHDTDRDAYWIADIEEQFHPHV